MVFERFYTYFPDDCDYPWSLRNIKQKPQDCQHEIVDIGIYDLLKPPYQHSKDKLRNWQKLKTDGWKVVPDFPDIVGEFGLEADIGSTTWESFILLKQYYNPADDSHLPVIQSKYQNITSFKRFIWHFKAYYRDRLGDDWEPSKIGIGSISKADNNELGVNMLKIARREFPNAWIHAFGLRFKQFRKGWRYINSYDSTSWTFPRGRGVPSCGSKAERKQFFIDYVKRINEVTPHLHQTQTTFKNTP